MDLSKLSKEEKIIGLGAIVGIVGCFLPWFSVGYGGIVAFSVSGLNEIGWLAFLAAIFSLVLVALPLFGQKPLELPIKESLLQMILGAVVAGIPVIQILRTSGATMSFGIFVAIAGGALIVWGGYMTQQKGRISKAE